MDRHIVFCLAAPPGWVVSSAAAAAERKPRPLTAAARPAVSPPPLPGAQQRSIGLRLEASARSSRRRDGAIVENEHDRRRTAILGGI